MSVPSWTHALSAMALVAGFLQSSVAHSQAADPDAAAPFATPISDQPVYAHALLDELEGRLGDGAAVPFRWDGEAWVGTDSDRLWIKSEGFAIDGQTQNGDQELLYDRPISSYFDLQTGLRYDLDSHPGRGWAAFGVEGLAPYWFQTSATLYLSDGGHVAGKLQFSYEEFLTQRLILEPLAELDLYTRSDPRQDVGAGLSDVDAELRLRYDFTRQVSPYLGVVYQRTVGAGPVRDPEDTGTGGVWRVALGVRMWL